MYGQAVSGDPAPEYELTEEWPAPARIGGHAIGFRFLYKDGTGRHSMDGHFHLFWRDGSWKVEEVYFTALDGQTAEEWIALSRDYRMLRPPPAEKGGKEPDRLAGESRKCPSATVDSRLPPGWYPALAAAGKGIGLLCAVVAGACAALGRWWERRMQGKAPADR